MPARFSQKTLSIARALIESVHDGMFIADHEGYFIMANEAFERITGINRQEMMDRHTQYMIDNNWVPVAVNLEVLKDYQARSRIVRYPSGRQLLVTAAMLWRDNGNPAAVVSTLRDLTELNRINEELKNSQVMIERFKKRIEYLEETLGGGANRFFVGQSTEFRRLLSIAKKVARSDATVMITGPSGVGKDVIAQFIHLQSPRQNTGAFVKVDCASLPANLLESELFGYDKGAFTDARIQGKQGMFELANGGTLFLDEIGEFPFELQAKLLNVLQDREIKHLGGLQKIPVDVRIVAATNMNLEQMVRERKFREDLYYRLNVIPVFIPPLRERREDILPMIKHFLKIYNQNYNTGKSLSIDALNAMLNYEWPGNVRELRNAIERVVVMSADEIITRDDLPGEIRKAFHFDAAAGVRPPGGAAVAALGSDAAAVPLRRALAAAERDLISHALKTSTTLAEAARRLQIDLSTLTRKKKKYGLMAN
ncbi:MAG: sigma 54-interacting transcriptional regulator [Pseudomonadota bacterium]|nr:sigma 54-interacting transcriptional regulator [Pseudomonadota bacterium]